MIFSGVIIDVSPAWLKITVYKRGEVIGKHFIEFLDMKLLAKVETSFPRLKGFDFVVHCSVNKKIVKWNM